MRGDHPPRRATAVLAGLSCLLLPLVGHAPKAFAASEADDRGVGAAPAAAISRGPGATGADACGGVSRTPRTFPEIVVQYQG